MKRTIQVLSRPFEKQPVRTDRFELSFGKKQKVKRGGSPLEDGRKMFLQGVIDR